MNYPNIFEFSIVIGLALQVLVAFLSWFFYIHPTRKRPFLWLAIGNSLVILRRIMVLLRFSDLGLKSIEAEYFLAMVISMFWILFFLDILFFEKHSLPTK